MIRQKIGKFFLDLFGWKILPLDKSRPKKTVICLAPHTSNLDFFIGKLYHWAIAQPSGFLMKKEWFKFPLKYILNGMGGIPIDRSKKGETVKRIAESLEQYDEIHIAITPEGTRKYTKEWHKGFYYIAQQANLPIELAVIDYKKKEVGILEVFYPTGDVEDDLKYIKSKYHSAQAKFPKKYNDC